MTDVSQHGEAQRFPFGTVGLVFPGLSVLAAVDVFHDLSAGVHPTLAALELIAMTAVIAVACFCWYQFVRARNHAHGLVKRLELARADAERWRREAANVLPALGSAVQRQFERWGLSDHERRIALLLLSGLSLHQIAQRIGSTTRSVRQLAVAVYGKAGVGGRVELSAFFLQDLFYLVGIPREAGDGELAAEL